MRKRSLLLIFVLWVTTTFAGFGCIAWAKGAKAVIDTAHVTCIINRAFLKDEEIAKFCQIEAELYPDMKEILSAHRKAFAGKAQSSNDSNDCMERIPDAAAPLDLR